MGTDKQKQEGTVIRTTGSSYVVKTDDNRLVSCFIKGNFRIKGLKTTNPVAIGDRVLFRQEDADHSLIEKIFERKNYIIRRSTKLSKQTQIIASNIDTAFLVISAKFPKTDTAFIDRFLVTANAYNVPCEIVFNKIDIYDQEAMLYAGYLIDIYEKIGYKCLLVSAQEGTGMNVLKDRMKGKITLFSGNSGVGKSTLINAICPSACLKTGEVSTSHLSGKHTTTFAQMIIEDDISIIDTPGIKSFGMVDFTKEELPLYFPEMKERLSDCKYYNCTHIHEPHCAIKQAVEDGEISIERYSNYLKMLNSEEMQLNDWETK
ncbi:MAG: ribosome small subunit-dependent GTPase A [Bacteroidales bacterium]|nr:ribosome small subunit-dependent GTPase A [Bacteroidales bacterium]MBQ9312916.1 ribosome small subunit-dependent GTPase A [Bacteroidales bacterium]